ncbi:hepcidin-like [Halichoeres trimaculatus]|uniref:hepcidin-like n=1 Tax=Halichoeres trimaculatus TaxID=147232 RepID=UPI003D9EB09D
MKTFGVAVVVAVVLTFMFIQESSAVPHTEVQEPEGMISIDNPVAEDPETSWGSWKMPYGSRQKRGIDCKFCCGCCTPHVCEFCCRF